MGVRVLCPPPSLLGGPCGPSILLFALSSSSFSTASCCDSPFEEKEDHFQWAVREAPCGHWNSTGTDTPNVHLCNTYRRISFWGAYWISPWFWMNAPSVSQPRTLSSGSELTNLGYTSTLPFLVNCNCQSRSEDVTQMHLHPLRLPTPTAGNNCNE